MKNIFVEGIQGMGKSTLVNKLAYTIPELKVCREGDYSPVDLAWCTWMTKEQYEKVLEKYKEIQDEIRKKTVIDGEHYVASYTQIITDIPNFHKDLEQYEVYNGRTSLEELKEKYDAGPTDGSPILEYNNLRSEYISLIVPTVDLALPPNLF